MSVRLSFSIEYPDLGIPNLNPFMFPHPIELQSIKITSLLTIQSYWSNVTAYGIDEIVFQEVR